jgi:competence protein ComEC
MSREPLVPIALALAAGVAIARFAPLEAMESAGAGLAFAALGIASRRAGSRLLAGITTLLAVTAAGAFVQIAHRPGPNPELDAAESELVIASGCVVEPPVFSEDRQQLILELERRARARITIYPRPGEGAVELRYGQRIEIDVRFRQPRNYQNPGAFDLVRHWRRREIYWSGSVSGYSSLRVLDGGCGTPWRAAVTHLRAAGLDRVDRLFGGSSRDGGLLRAVLLGDASRIHPGSAENFRRTGTYHVLVVSGIHLTTVGAAILFFLRLARVGVTTALAATSLAVWLYAAICGGTPPVIRAAMGLTLFALGRWFYRRPSLLNILSAIAILFLVFDPEQLFDASFQLSFLAVATIGSLAVPILERTTHPVAGALFLLGNADTDFSRGPRRAEWRIEMRLLAETAEAITRIPRRIWLGAVAVACRAALYFAELAIVSLAIQMGMALLLVFYFHRLPVSSITANLIVAVPMTLVVPIGLLAILTAWSPLVQGTAALTRFAESANRWHVESLPGGRIPDPPGWLAVAVLATLFLLAWAALRRPRVCWFAAPVFGLATALLWLHPFPAERRAGSLELTAIDVGQGESLLVVTPEGRTLLIDAGGTPGYGRKSPTRFNIGEDVVSSYLWTRSVRRLDAAAITHGDADHAGGLMAILENFRPVELWISEPLAPELAQAARAAGTRIRAREAGSRFTWGGATIEVLNAAGAGPARPHGNDNSLVLRLSYGRHAFLLTGDIEKSAEFRLLAANAPIRADVLKVAHHGSRTSTTEDFLEAARPAVALISAGPANPYRHPHPDVLSRLSRRHIMTLRTDLHGLSTVFSDGVRLTTSYEAHPRMTGWLRAADY